MKHILTALITTLLFIQSTSAQYLSVEFTSPEDGAQVHGGEFGVSFLFNYTGANPVSVTHIDGFVDGQLWFSGYINTYVTPYSLPMTRFYKTQVKGPHTFVVVAWDGITSSQDTLTVFR